MTLVSLTSSPPILNSFSPFEKKMETSASDRGLPFFPPLKMRLLDFSARMDFALNLPRTKQSASIKFDLPAPFGPRTTLYPFPKSTSMGFAKLLKPRRWSFLIIAILGHPSFSTGFCRALFVIPSLEVFIKIIFFVFRGFLGVFFSYFYKMLQGLYPMEITSKPQSYALWQQGRFGNKFRTWNSLEDIERDDFVGEVTMRYRGSANGFCDYRVPVSKISQMQHDWLRRGAQLPLITFNESAPDNRLVLQGEVQQSREHLSLTYSTERELKMREAMKGAKHASGLTARLLLERHLWPVCLNELHELLTDFPGAVVEFSAYDRAVGCFPHRNTVVWEVRHY